MVCVEENITQSYYTLSCVYLKFSEHIASCFNFNVEIDLFVFLSFLNGDTINRNDFFLLFIL